MSVIGQLSETQRQFEDLCQKGNHPLDPVYYAAESAGGEAAVVRWCRVCGSVVVDLDIDNRPSKGAVMSMKRCLLTDDYVKHIGGK